MAKSIVKSVKKTVSGDEEACDEIYKKSKLRTASDVISRLQWDESLPKELFVVGYLDRFKGLTEKPFTTLDWSDPAVVDNYTLALPKHRIQYFKYKNRKVWDKNMRLDVIFGSTNEPLNIYDFMKKVDDAEYNFCCEDENMGYSDEDDVADYVQEKVYDNSDRSNFFVAVRIDDEETVKKLNEVADNIRAMDPSLTDCCMAKEVYHITLATLKLDSPEDVSNAVEALREVKMDQMAILTLEKLDIFLHRVLYASIVPDEQLSKLRENLLTVLEDREFEIKDKFNFVPHVTIVKLSRSAVRAKHTNLLDPSLYLKFQDNCFGSQIIHKLYLCEMGEGRREDGFYRCALEMDLL